MFFNIIFKISSWVSEYDMLCYPLQETMDCLCEIYTLLKEEDMFAGIWQKRAKYAETSTALAYMQHGFFEQAQTTFEAVSV